ncbi:MAG: 2OG-Fe(II) oxygenase [Pseudomonas sp.]|uniref:2OG-Fe(II) oxygenase n=1 Tax=Pseudomonas sp. TaxID=306 RepID=UPI002734C94D|nr:2OG-Fe(II) oxygenase [Pseudomonas sp.]MDP3848737.1 2OG-Fe(II) oxygenase [Pseudomonas sp.]
MSNLNEISFALLIDDLAEHGWAIQHAALPVSLTLELAAECHARENNGRLLPAGVGRGAAQGVHQQVRGDHIEWLEAEQSPASAGYLAVLEALRCQLNQALYLGLDDFEGHFALYPPGAFYQKHLDRFRSDDRRSVSVVFYLNPDWLPEQGGALRLYLDAGRELDVYPQAGTLLLFMSADWPHAVLPASRERLSLTGWFRRRGNHPL